MARSLALQSQLTRAEADREFQAGKAARSAGRCDVSHQKGTHGHYVFRLGWLAKDSYLTAYEQTGEDS